MGNVRIGGGGWMVVTNNRMTNLFFMGYGLGDLAFGLFFLKAFLDHRKKNDTIQTTPGVV